MKREKGFAWGGMLVVFAVLLSYPPAVSAKDKPAAPEKQQAASKQMVKDSLGRLVEKPRYGGVLREGWATPPVNFDEAFGHIGLAPTLYLTHDALTIGDWTKGPTGTGEASWIYDMRPSPATWIGHLAESWDFPEPDTLAVHIRKGARFHNKPPVNGRELTAEDVLFSLKRVFETPKCYHHTAYAKQLESITAPDRWTVLVKCKPGTLALVYDMILLHFKTIPHEVIDQYGDMNDWRNSVGTGPFILTEYVSDTSLTFERNPDWWNNDPFFPKNRLPYIDRVTWLIVPDISTRLAAVRTGKIDVLSDVSWEDCDSLKKTNPELKNREYFPGTAPAIWMKEVSKPDSLFHDKRVRRALALAIDNQSLIEHFYGGNADLITYPIMAVPEMMDMFTPFDQLPDSTRELYEFHPEKAKQLLTEAGYPNGFKVEILCQKPDVDLLSIIKNQWAAVGVDAELDVREYAAYVSTGLANNFKDVYFFITASTFPMKFLWMTPGNVYNFSHVDDPVVNEWKSKVAASFPDETQRRRLMKQAAPYMMDQCYSIYLPGQHVYTFWQPRVKGYSGERMLGKKDGSWPAYLWIDQSLQQKTTTE